MNFGKDIEDFGFEIYYNQMHLNFLASHTLLNQTLSLKINIFSHSNVLQL